MKLTPTADTNSLHQKWCLKKARIKSDRLSKFYKPYEKILEVGSGNCALAHIFREGGVEITALDIKNKSAFKNLEPILYNGEKLPFKDNEFDVVQFITVLHHIPFDIQEKLILEAKRVGKRIIIMEDIYDSEIQKHLTFIADSINNNEYRGHPHSNRNDDSWKRFFEKHELEIKYSEYYEFLFFFKQVTYELNIK